jgi:hypothetical protein
MDSPFSSVLDTNYVPSDDKVTAIKEMVPPWTAVLKELDEQMRALAEERDRQAKFIDEHNALITPVRRLHTDILSYIFISYLDLCRWRSSYRGRQHPSVLLTHVCRRWREIGLSNPLLWSTIRIRYPNSPLYFNETGPPAVADRLAECWSNLMHNEEAILTMCLKRSGSCPLRLSATVIDHASFSTVQVDEDVRRRLTAAIRDTSPRWEHVSLDMSLNTPYSPLLELLRIPPERAPQLRSLEVACYMPLLNGDRALHSSCRDFRLFHAEGLHTVKWGIPLVELSVISTIPVGWQGLTELYVNEGSEARGQLSFSDAIALMEKCPNLVHCTLSLHDIDSVTRAAGVSANSPTSSAAQPFIFQRKVSLLRLQTLGVRSEGIPTGFASTLVLPAIRSISLYGNNHRADDRGIVEFIQLFGDQLQDVALSFASLSQEGLVTCLQCLPVVTRLQLVGGYREVETTRWFSGQDVAPRATLDPPTLAGFHPRYDADGALVTQCYCPRLEQLFCNLTGQEFIEEALVEFMKSRRSIPDNSRLEIARIRDVVLCWDLSETLNVQHALEEAGVDMAGCHLQIRHLGLDRAAERQLEPRDDLLDMYGDVCHDTQLHDCIPNRSQYGAGACALNPSQPWGIPWL